MRLHSLFLRQMQSLNKHGISKHHSSCDKADAMTILNNLPPLLFHSYQTSHKWGALH